MEVNVRDFNQRPLFKRVLVTQKKRDKWSKTKANLAKTLKRFRHLINLVPSFSNRFFSP